jgi:hypothetical protein
MPPLSAVIDQDGALLFRSILQECGHFADMSGIASVVIVPGDKESCWIVHALLHMVVGGIAVQHMEVFKALDTSILAPPFDGLIEILVAHHVQ